MTITLAPPPSPATRGGGGAIPDHIAALDEGAFVALMLDWRRHSQQGLTPWTDAELIEAFLATCSRSGSAETQAAYARDLHLFQAFQRRWRGEESEGAFALLAPGDPQEVTAWAAELRSAAAAGEISRRTVNRRLSTISAFYSWAADVNQRARSGIPTTPVPRKLAIADGAAPPVALGHEQLFRLLQGATSRRDELILRAVYSLGARASELVNMRCSDITSTTDGATVTICGKGSKTRRFRINATVAALLAELAAMAGDSPWLLPGRDPSKPMCRQTLGRIVRRAGAAAGISAWPHLLRHCHATHAHQATKDLKMISATLGHASVSITADLYVSAAGDDSSCNHLAC
jgi:integrase/recombinase XerD